MYSPSCYIGSDEIDQDLSNICLLVDSHRWHHLHLDNTTWLDTTWHLPTVVTHEFVPAADLGVAVVLVNGWPVVTSVQESSVAAEDDKVEVGDVITHINDVSVVGATTTRLSTPVRLGEMYLRQIWSLIAGFRQQVYVYRTAP